MPEPIPSSRRRRRRRRRIARTLVAALVPFLLLVVAALLSLGIVEVVERSSPTPAPQELAPEDRIYLERPARDDDDLTLPGSGPADLRRDALPASVVEPEDQADTAAREPASLGAALPSVDAGPAVVPEPGTALLVAGGLALLKAGQSLARS